MTKMIEVNTDFANCLIDHPELSKATSKMFRSFSEEKLPSAIKNQVYNFFSPLIYLFICEICGKLVREKVVYFEITNLPYSSMFFNATAF